MSSLLIRFLSFQQQVRLYHWSTKSYARHISSGTLYEKIDNLIDTFIETMQGKFGKRIEYKNMTFTLSHMSDKDAQLLLHEFIQFLENDLNRFLDKVGDNDLKNIRDEMLSTLNQTLYLFSFA
jgi:LPS O-antigen subunit length determinant protein (WzzB/FepE family)